jgi:hypothetical protein
MLVLARTGTQIENFLQNGVTSGVQEALQQTFLPPARESPAPRNSVSGFFVNAGVALTGSSYKKIAEEYRKERSD